MPIAPQGRAVVGDRGERARSAALALFARNRDDGLAANEGLVVTESGSGIAFRLGNGSSTRVFGQPGVSGGGIVGIVA